jgi:hypothetical protein
LPLVRLATVAPKYKMPKGRAGRASLSHLACRHAGPPL